MGRQIHSLTLKRETNGQKWGFGLTGGKDVALTFRIEKVALASPAGAAGLKNLDYLVKVNGQEVFEKRHSDVVQMFTACGPPRLKMGKYNAPVGLYSDETIMELGSGNHGFVDPDKLAPDACEKAKNR